MEAITLEQLKTFCRLMSLPVYLVRQNEMLALNKQAQDLNAGYQDVLSVLPKDADEFEPLQMKVEMNGQDTFYSIAGRRILCDGEECWLAEVTTTVAEATMQNLYRVSTARKIMLEMAAGINHLDTEKDIYEFILTNCGKAVQHSDLCSLLAVDGKTARIVAKRGYGDAAYNIVFNTVDTFIGLATDGKFDQTVIINDLAKFQSKYYTEIRTENGNFLLKSTLSAPIFINEKLYGILCFDSTETNAFTKKDADLLDLVKTNIERILENHQMTMEIRQLSTTDILTGLYNRTYLQDYMRKHYDRKFFVGMFDMNSLKEVNDRHGHACGDMMIQTMADTLRYMFPENSALFRIGGDEFLCLIYEENIDAIKNKVITTRNELAKLPILLSDGSSACLSFSCGFALHQPGDSLNDVLQIADHIMYEEKRESKARRD